MNTHTMHHNEENVKACHKTQDSNVHAHHASSGSSFSTAVSATLHCLIGCSIGEFVGLAIGVSLGLPIWQTITLATTLAFISGYTLGLVPLVKQGRTWAESFKAIWLGETISIAVMELAMNFTDFHMGGMNVSSVFEPNFWMGFGLALPAGFIAALPVNYWLLNKSLKKPCH